ncbi:energy transducer TonB [Caulobacter endophyticus]|uniref:energy transducer TonB n=1 Tax=Caulobacter endophyticus TaxID=2172652 RepID=UPI00240FBCE1|nr:TonB family protein [Caulobacter endophyticus]MDG2527265.1 TonB family protein [Caulobacter endophyticus]
MRAYPRHFNVLGFAGAVILHGLFAAALLFLAPEEGAAPVVAEDGAGAILVSLVSEAPAKAERAAPAAVPPMAATARADAVLVQAASAQGEGGGREDRQQAARDGGAVGGVQAVSIDPATGSDYRARLLAHIQPFRRYPARAQDLDARGVAQILFMVEQNGKVSGVWVKASSGFEVLDAEAVATVLRAQPMPHVPAGLPSPLAVQLPVSFSPS